MRPSLLTRLSWLLQDIWELSPLARVRRRVHALRGTRGWKVVGALLVALLVVAGFVAARTIARTPKIASPQTGRRVITVQRRVLQRVGSRPAGQPRLRTVYAHGRTVTRSAAPGTVHDVRVVTTPAHGTNGRAHTVSATVTNTATQTRVRSVTVTRPVTVVTTTTVLSITTVSVPVTVTVTVP